MDSKFLENMGLVFIRIDKKSLEIVQIQKDEFFEIPEISPILLNYSRELKNIFISIPNRNRDNNHLLQNWE